MKKQPNNKTSRFKDDAQATSIAFVLSELTGEPPEVVADRLCPGQFDPLARSPGDVPTNTANLTKNRALDHLAEAMMVGSETMIERMESRGQQELVESQVLPTNMGGNSGEVKKQLESIGFKFLGPVEGDKLFQRVEFPKGWKKEATDHSMWSTLVDDRGRERASIFYKADFYDRDAFMHLNRRFLIKWDYSRRDELVAVVHVRDGNQVVFSTKEVKTDSTKNWYSTCDALEKEALAWLTERYPNWQDVAAYWD